ncbi:MAG: extracellular solute-binding protein [Clostridiaceae bacterium]
MKRLTALIIVLALLGTLMLTGCSDKKGGAAATPTVSSDAGAQKTEATPTPAKTQEILTCKYVLPGDKPVEYEKVEEIINKKLSDDGVGIKLERQYIPWDAWDQKTNIMLQTGEKFDLLNVMGDRKPVSSYAGEGALTDITKIMDQYGENIKKVNPDSMINACKVDDKIYAVPAFWVEFSYSPEITIRTDLLKEYGLSVPKSFEELTTAFETVMKNWKGKQKPYLALYGAKVYKFGMDQKSYDSWPFWIYDDIFFVNQNTGEVKNYFETAEFKHDCENAHSWYQKGLINPDVLVFKQEQLDAQLDSGDWFVHPGTYGKSIDNIKKNYPNITAEDFEFLNFFPDKPNMRPYGTRNMNAVPSTSVHPEVGVKFLNWLYTNQENYDLYLYGREGIDYKKKGDKGREDIIDLAKGRPLYFADDWMVGNLTFERLSGNVPRKTEELKFTIDKTAVDSIAGTFVFDASNVKGELANVRTEMAANICPLACGVLEYDKAIGPALDKLKKAGIDKVVNEYKTQFEAYKAKKGK